MGPPGMLPAARPYSPQHTAPTALPAAVPPQWCWQPMVLPPSALAQCCLQQAARGARCRPSLPMAPGLLDLWEQREVGEPRPHRCSPLRMGASPTCRAAPRSCWPLLASVCSVPAPPSQNAKRQALISSAASSAQREKEKRNPFSINTLQVHSSNQAEAAVKNSSASLGLVPCVRGALAAGEQAWGRNGGLLRVGTGQSWAGHGGLLCGMDGRGASAVHGALALREARQGVGRPTCVGHGWSGHGTCCAWGRAALGTGDLLCVGHGWTGHRAPSCT